MNSVHTAGNILLLALLTLFSAACSTYYQDNVELQRHLEKGRVQEAYAFLDQSEDKQRNKNRILYLMNQGVVTFLLGKTGESNKLLNEADYMAEDYTTSLGQDLLAYLTNPAALPYRPEYFESVMLHYYKAMNYIHEGNYEAALVECRRINIKLNELNDRYEYESRYKRDAFALTLMGLVYDAAGDYNNAFIAYRNALEAYENDYKPLFGLEAPLQLKQDLLRAAYRSGFSEAMQRFEKQFGMQYTPDSARGGEVLFFWHTGFGPVKSEWSVTFHANHGEDGWVHFNNEFLDLSFPFFIGDRSEKDRNTLKDLHIVRIAFPAYTERKPVYTQARLETMGKHYPLQAAQNIDAIAHKSLEDRMMQELGTALLRVALKKAAELTIRTQNETVGALLGIANAVTEQADTRNWQTLPYAIHYTRLHLPAGEQQVRLVAEGPDGVEHSEEFTWDIVEGRTLFHSYHSLQTYPPGAGYRR